MTSSAEFPDGSSLPRLAEDGRTALFTAARTSNTFAGTPVTDDELRGIWDLAKWPPTGGNVQPLRVLFVRTPDGKERLLKHVAEGNVAKITQAPVTAVLAADTEFHEYIPQVLPFRPQMREVFAADEERRRTAAEYNTALQSGYFILAVRSAGLAAGPMGGFDKEGVDAEFFPEGRLKAQLLVNIGHPGEQPWLERLPRLDEETTLSWA